MKILLIHQYYVKGESAGGSRWNEMTRFWKDMGHEVTVVAGMFSFQLGRNYPEYEGKYIVREYTDDGIEVLRAYTPSNYDKNFLWRAWAYISFVLFGLLAVCQLGKRFDVVIASSPPLTVGALGVAVSKLKRVPLVFEVRDLWPESAVDTGVLTNKYMIGMLRWLESFSYKNAKRINVLTPAFYDALVQRRDQPPQKVWTIPNGADLELITPGPKNNHVREKHDWGQKFVGLYIGAHGRANHLWQLIEAAKLLRDDPRFLIASVGNGMEREALMAKVQEEGLDNIQFLPAVNKTEVKYYLQACDASLIVLKKVDTFKTVYPNKMFDSMSAARPIILAIDGAARKLTVDQAQAGVFVEPENAEEIVAAMREYRENPELLDRHGQNGLEYVRQHYDRRKLGRKYVRLIEEQVATSSGGRRGS